MTDHVCIDKQAADCRAAAVEGFSEEQLTMMENKTGNDFITNGLFNDLEAQIVALANGFVVGRASTGATTPENMLVDMLSEQLCLRCLFLWLKQAEGCCFTHTVAALLTKSNNVAVVEIKDFSCTPFDPSFN